MKEKTILLAGYGWFMGIPEGETNNSEMIANALDGEILETARHDGRIVRGRVHSMVMPVVWEEAFPAVQAAIKTLQPDVVVALGTDARASALRPEPYAVNWQRGVDAKPDHPEQQTTMNGPILPGGKPWLRGTLPYEDMVLASLKACVPAQIGSLQPPQEDVPLPHTATPGLYLCNKMTYLLAAYGQSKHLPAGFIHVPTQPAYAAKRKLERLSQAAPETYAEELARPIAAMPLAMMIDGVRAMLTACLAALGPDPLPK